MDEVIKHAIIGISGGDTNVNSDSNKIKPAKKNKGAKKRKVK